MPRETQHARDLKKAVGTPKIIFVLGGPATGKGTQCAKLVEEFGYQHISTGDLLRIEMDRGTPEGDDIKRIMEDGQLVPNQMTIQLLIKAIMSRPSKKYLIDGFPRTLDQALYFEQNVLEAQQVLYFDAPKELMLERCLKRAETSGRADDTAEVLEKRVQTFLDSSYPVVEHYEKFGKVSRIDATGDVASVSAATKAAMLPKTMFLLGQKASGKSAVAKNMVERATMKHIDFTKWVVEQQLEDQDDETVCLQLIQTLAEEQQARVVLEDFPKNEFQAKFFLRNCTPPSNVFYLSCSIDVSQARINSLDEKNADYVSSIQLSKDIKTFCDASKSLLPYLKQSTNFAEINTEGNFDKTMEQVNSRFEPCVIHIRPGAKSEALRKEITQKLCSDHDFMNLDVSELVKGEIMRQTSIGLEMHQMDVQGKPIPANMIVRMLQKIIYCGRKNQSKFILTSFPETIDQVREFEKNCSKIQTVIYSTADEPVVEIANNNLGSYNIDSQFQKEFRLATMNCWDFSVFQEKLGNKVEFGVMLGQSLSGKTTLAGIMKNNMDFILIDMKAISELVRDGMKNEEGEPFEGDIPVKSVEDEVVKIVEQHQAAPGKKKYLFDGFIHKEPQEFIKFLSKFGMPSFILKLKSSDKFLKERFCKKNEVEEFPEDQIEVFKELQEVDVKAKKAFDDGFLAFAGRCSMLDLNTDNSLETTSKQLMSLFAPQIILVNHEKSLDIDTVSSNLAIKYNMIYVSAYQVIAEHIKNNTKWGQLLMASKRTNEPIKFDEGVSDSFNEAEYCVSLYDQKLVLDLMRATIQEKRTNQKYVLLEGFCKASKVAKDEDKLELRLMDEFFSIEKHIGDIKAVLSLQFQEEVTVIDNKGVAKIKFSEEDKAAQKPQAPADGEEPPAEDGGEAKAPSWNPSDYDWTITNKQPKNLPQLFIRCKKKATVKQDTKQAVNYSNQSEPEAIQKSMDDLCNKIQSDAAYHYYQVVFSRE